MPPSRSRRFFVGFAASLCALLTAIGAFNYVVDPFHYYRGLNAINPVLLGSGLQRYLNVGLARHFRYDTVVIGSSITENFLPSYLARSWGVRAMKLSISGATSYEQRLILEEALRTGQVQHVIWAADFGFYGGANLVRDDQTPFPYHMYRHLLPNLEYLLSSSTFDYSRKILKGYGTTDLDALDTWYARFTFSRDTVLRSWDGDCTWFGRPYRNESRLPPIAIAAMREAVQQNLAAPIRAHPATVFDVFFSPTTTLYYVPANTGSLLNALPLRQAVAEAVHDLPNVRLSDFQTDSRLTDALEHYKDLIHFDLTTTEYVIDALRDGSHRIDAAEIGAANEKLVRHVNEYTLCRDGALLGAAAQIRPGG